MTTPKDIRSGKGGGEHPGTPTLGETLHLCTIALYGWLHNYGLNLYTCKSIYAYVNNTHL